VRRVVALALLALTLPVGAAAEPQRLVFPTLLGEYHLDYNDRRVSETDLRQMAILSPHLAGWNSLAVAPRLERCVVDDPAFLQCGSRSPKSHAFLWNARVNLDRGAAALARLRELRVAPELEPVSTWLQRSLAFSLWLEETKLEFFGSADVSVLRRRYEDVDLGRDCGPAANDAARASSPDAQFDLVTLRWHNCVNSLFRRRLGEYPMGAWKRFLSAWQITERFVEGPPRETERQ
jgi:hypothetical protein